MKLRNVIAAAAFAMTCAPALALPSEVVFSNVTGLWQAADPASTTITPPGNVGAPLTTARWGIPASASGQSGYDFTAAPDPIPSFFVNPPAVSINTELLGTFNHLNFPIFPPFLESIQLRVNADVAVDGFNQGNFAFLFDFTHDETDNGGPPGGPFTGTCPYPTAGSPNGAPATINEFGCADQVTVSANVASQVFSVGGVHFTLDILGFSQDGGLTITDTFQTTETLNNTAGLYARVKAVENQVPEPGSLLLVGLALLAVGFVRRSSIG